MVTQEEQMIEDLKEAGKYKKPVLAGEVLRKGFQKGIKSYKIPVRERRESAIARKAISLIAPSGSIVKAITQVKKKKGSRGRGRPSGTYKVRYLPSGRAVKVPTHIYKKMLAAEKAQMRLAQAQQMAQVQMQADQLAMQQDMRYQPSVEDQFLAEPDQQHEMDVARARQLAEMEQMAQVGVQQKPSVGQRIIKGVGDFGRGVSRIGAVRRQPMVDEYGRLVEQPQMIQRAPGVDMRPREPRVTVLGKASLLNVPNSFNNPGQSSILWNKERRRLY